LSFSSSRRLLRRRSIVASFSPAGWPLCDVDLADEVLVLWEAVFADVRAADLVFVELLVFATACVSSLPSFGIWPSKNGFGNTSKHRNRSVAK